MPRKSDHLDLHGGQWRVRMAVPADVRPAFGGKSMLLQPLRTPDLNEANRLKGTVLSRWRSEIALARNPNATLTDRALAYRSRKEAAPTSDAQDDVDLQAARASDDVEAKHGEEAGAKFYEIATGFSTPIAHHINEWLEDRRFVAKTDMLHRTAIALLVEWCERQALPYIRSITKRVAWEFTNRVLRARGLSETTVNRYLSTCRTYWAWLEGHGYASDNPWRGVRVSQKRPKESDTGKRPPTDAELLALLDGDPPPPLRDLIMVAALTGTRINAICSLRIRDCARSVFRFKPAKKEKRSRDVPIHSKLLAIVKRRCDGEQPDDFLFPELPEATPTRPRSAAASQAFTRYRRKLGIDETPDGERTSNVDFHSFRRWFITKAEQAGQHPHIIEAVVGHKRQGESMGRYSRGPSIEQLKACVEAVKLPTQKSIRNRAAD